MEEEKITEKNEINFLVAENNEKKKSDENFYSVCSFWLV